jgi:cytochrome c556
MKDADALGTVGAAVQKAAEAKDFAALQAAAGGINATCQGCHSVYRARPQQKKQ